MSLKQSLHNQAHIYCSLDIETTGFDPLTEEVLEVGFVFFEAGSKGLKLKEEWTQVFRPNKPVSPKILGLTGISKQELDIAPNFSSYRDFLQQKLGSAIIVGHNVGFDVKFLESHGLKFAGVLLDTLDLAQWLLPAHHSYNLENLMHYFKVPHTEAHRALADAKAAVKVLEKLLARYATLPEAVKTEIENLVQPFDLPWKPLLKVSPTGKKTLNQAKTQIKHPVQKIEAHLRFSLAPERFYNFPLFSDYVLVLLKKLKKLKKPSLLVVPRKEQVMSAWQRGLADSVFLPEDTFDPSRLEELCAKQTHTLEEAKFLLKLLVWQATNWQTRSLLDLNLTFFGGQFKSLVARNDFIVDSKAKIWICDTQTFLNLVKSQIKVADRFTVVCGLSELETALGLGISHRVSWGFVTYLLKSYYNPETQTGSENYKEEVETALGEADLFFGLANALLKQQPAGFEYYKVVPGSYTSEAYQKVRRAAENYVKKLKSTGERLGARLLVETADHLLAFFEEAPNRVKWIELSDSRCVFYDSPINLKGTTQKLLEQLEEVCFVDSLPASGVPELFLSRLGLESMKRVTVLASNFENQMNGQGELFDDFPVLHKVSCQLLGKTLTSAELRTYLEPENLPAAALLSSPVQVREFHDQYYEAIQGYANLLSQNHSGGSSKLFRNFEIYPESVLLVTDKLVLRYLTEMSGRSLNKLTVKTLIIGRLPFEQYTHPYLEAVANTYEHPFEQFSLPRAAFNLSRILDFFYTHQLKLIVIADPKVAKDYFLIFEDFLRNIPRFQVKRV